MDRLSMSLDQLIEKKNQEKKESFAANKSKQNGNKGKNFGAAKKPRSNNPDADDRNTQPYSQKVVREKQPLTYRPIKVGQEKSTFTVNVNNSDSVFDRIGRSQSGTYVTISNLNRSVALNDLKELTSSVGEVKDVSKPQGGASKVLFARRSDAAAFIAKYNGLTLDGQVMNVDFTEETKTVFDRIQSAPSGNVKSSMFGTSLTADDDEDEDDEGSDAGNGPVFRVTMKGAPQLGNSTVKFGGGNNNNNGNGRKRNDGGRGNKGQGRKNREPRAPKTEVNLDDDLDAYMNNR